MTKAFDIVKRGLRMRPHPLKIATRLKIQVFV